jgi:hypothetical protein
LKYNNNILKKDKKRKEQQIDTYREKDREKREYGEYIIVIITITILFLTKNIKLFD